MYALWLCVNACSASAVRGFLPAARRVQISIQVLRTEVTVQRQHLSYWSYEEFSPVGNLALNRGKKGLREDSNLTRFSSGPTGDRATVYLPCMQRGLHLRTQPYSGEQCTVDHNQRAWIWEIMMFWFKYGASFGAGKAVFPHRQSPVLHRTLCCVHVFNLFFILCILYNLFRCTVCS